MKTNPSVHIERAPELGKYKYKVVRTRLTEDRLLYLTANGWKEKLAGEKVIFDDTMIWNEIELRELTAELLELYPELSPKP